MATVDILLPCFNGEAYLAQQLESLCAQSYSDWRVLARDDGSQDGTVAILRSYAARLGEGRFLLLDGAVRPAGGGGAKENYSRLMLAATAPYVMLCDQDDVWLPNKVGRAVQGIRQQELQSGAEVPLLLFTDLSVVDERLQPIADSFWHYAGIHPDYQDEGRLMLSNVVTGCTAIMNRALLKKACPVPAEAVMHDWWLALIAALFGQLTRDTCATVLYRQHTLNAVGAHRPRYRESLANLPATRRRLSRNLQALSRQAQACLARYEADLSLSQQEKLRTLIALEDMGWWQRRYEVWRSGVLGEQPLPNRLFLLAFL